MIDLLGQAGVHDRPAAKDLSRCVHCGLCLPTCPTYVVTAQETESPRGRIHLIQAVQEGRIAPSDTYATHIDRCLVCRACETACPSGVPFGRIMEAARAQLAEQREQSRLGRFASWLLFKQMLPRNRRLRLAAGGLRFYQRSRLQRLTRILGLTSMLPPTLQQMEQAMPSLRDDFFEPAGDYFPAFPENLVDGKPRMRVGLFVGCVMPLVYGRVHEATVRVLRRLGCDVVIPRVQGCCGALNVHSGERQTAREMARRNVRAFLDLDLDAIVVNSAGCGSTLKEYGELLGSDPRWSERAHTLAERIRDVTELVATLPFDRDLGPVRRRVTLQESCHLVHAQRIKDPPRAILAAIPGLDFVDMEHPDMCCGSAGMYSFVQPGLSNEILDRKMTEVRATEADVLVTANPGCMLQLETGLRNARHGGEVRHVIELLDWAQSGA